MRTVFWAIVIILLSSSTGTASDIRRVVTGLDANNKAIVLFDNRLTLGPGPYGITALNLWLTDSYPARFSFQDDPATKPIGLSLHGLPDPLRLRLPNRCWRCERRFPLRGGQPKIYVKVAESGVKRAQAFCPECGTPIYSAAVGDTPVFALRVGTIRQRAELRPYRQYWCRSALPWVKDLDSVAQFERQVDLNQFLGNVRRS